MDSGLVKNTISAFFEKKVSRNTQLLFRKWFRLEENQKEKEEAMEEIWENSPSVISSQTLDDLNQIKSKIAGSKTNVKQVFVLRRIISYAAAVSLLIATTVYITYKATFTPSLEYTQLSVSYGESKKVTLADGSVVVVNAGSTLIYPKSFTADTRTVFLSGEANFSVAKNPDKPFIVKTKNIDVKALGTKFYIQSYPNSDYTKATLIEGSVKVDMEMNKSKSYILKPNNQLSFSHRDNKVSITDVDAEKLASWEEGYLIFQGVSFDEIVSALERKYNVAINYDGKKLSQQSYYVKFSPDESINEVMDVLTMLISNSSFKIEGSNVYFYKK